MTPRARSLLFFGITVVLAIIFVRLGVWQLSRRAERRAENRAAAAARALPPLDLDDPVAAAALRSGEERDRRVSVTGRYDHAAELVLRGQIVQGVPGVRFVTPLRPLRGDTAILVQRGYVSSPDAQTIDPAKFVEEGVRRVTGILVPLADSGAPGQPIERGGRRTWRRVDLRLVRERLPYPVASYYILQAPESSLPSLPRRDGAPPLDEGAHLSYAIQWFSFAATALVVGYIVGFRSRS